MSISFLSVFSNVSVCSAHLIILFHPSSDLLTITTSRDRPFSPPVANQTVVHLWRWSILCNFPLHICFSVLGPTTWNVLPSDLQALNLPKWCLFSVLLAFEDCSFPIGLGREHL